MRGKAKNFKSELFISFTVKANKYLPYGAREFWRLNELTLNKFTELRPAQRLKFIASEKW